MHFMDILCIYCTSRTFLYLFYRFIQGTIYFGISKQLNDICIKTCSRFLNVVAIANPNNL